MEQKKWREQGDEATFQERVPARIQMVAARVAVREQKNTQTFDATIIKHFGFKRYPLSFSHLE